MEEAPNCTYSGQCDTSHYMLPVLGCIGSVAAGFAYFQIHMLFKKQSKLVTLLLLKSLIIVDYMNLILSAFVNWVFNFTNFIFLFTGSYLDCLNIMCKLYNYMIHTCLLHSHWLLVFLCIDRCLMLTKHRFLRSYYSRFAGKIFLSLYFVTMSLANCNYLWIFNWSKLHKSCSIAQAFVNIYYYFIKYLEFVINSLLPFLAYLMITCINIVLQLRSRYDNVYRISQPEPSANNPHTGSAYRIPTSSSTSVGDNSRNVNVDYYNRKMFALIYFIILTELVLDSFGNFCKFSAIVFSNGTWQADYYQFNVVIFCLKLIGRFLTLGFGVIVIKAKKRALSTNITPLITTNDRTMETTFL